MRALAIFVKDIKSYYSKAPVISWGLLFPVALIVLLSFNVRVFGEYRMVPAMLSLTMLFASTSMAQVAVSFEKLSGSIQRLLYMPITSADLVIAKSLGGILYGLAGTGIAGLAAYVATHHVAMIRPPYFAAGVALGASVYTLISVLIALHYDPIKAVAALNIVRFTMLFLGGILFPKALLPRPLRVVAYLLPSSYITDLVRFGMYNTWEYVDPYTSLIVLALLLASLSYAAHRLAMRLLMP